MTCCARYADYGSFSSESFTQTEHQCAKHMHVLICLDSAHEFKKKSCSNCFCFKFLFFSTSRKASTFMQLQETCTHRAQISVQINPFYPRTGYGLQEGVHAISCPPLNSCCPPLNSVCVCVDTSVMWLLLSS